MTKTSLKTWILIAILFGTHSVIAQDESKKDSPAGQETASTAVDEQQAVKQAVKEDTATRRELAEQEAELLTRFPNFLGELKAADGFSRLTEEDAIWMHKEKKMVIVAGHVCLRRGALEMFACPSRTKEHESVVATAAKSRFVHAALLLSGAKVGNPVQYQPEYAPASGTEIGIYVLWKDKAGKSHAVRAQDWIRDWKTKKAMSHSWVFAGSEFWNDPMTGERHYSADSGELICLSNFSTAMLDIPIESSQSDGALLFEAFTERIPPLRTEVRLVFVPKVAPKAAPKKEKPASSDVNVPKETTTATESSSSDDTSSDDTSSDDTQDDK